MSGSNAATLAMLLVTSLGLLSVGCDRSAPGHEGHAHDDGHDDHARDEGGHDDHSGHGDDDDHSGHGDDDDHDGHGDEGAGIIQLSPDAARAIRVRTEPVREQAWSGGIQTTGEVHFDGTRVAHVSPRLEGRIHRVLVGLGDRVEQGQALAVVDSVELGRVKADYLSARARLELTEQTLSREESLLARRISSEQEVIEARAAREEAAAVMRSVGDTLRVLGLTQADLRRIRHGDPEAPHFTVRAPIAGKIIELHATLGELVGPSTELAIVADLSQLWVWVDIYEQDIGRVRAGDRARVTFDAFAGESVDGRLAYVRDELDRATRAVRARVDLANPEERLKPGMFARVVLEEQAAADGGRTVVVPVGAIQRVSGEDVAFVCLDADRFERRHVEIGRRSERLAEVLSGLEPGEEVVVEGGFVLKSELGKSEMGHGHSH